MFVSQGLQVLVVSVLVGAVLRRVRRAGDHAARRRGLARGARRRRSPGQRWLSVELVKVSSALAAFSGLYYAIAVLTEATYRQEFLADVETSLRETFLDRARYLDLRAEREAA